MTTKVTFWSSKESEPITYELGSGRNLYYNERDPEMKEVVAKKLSEMGISIIEDRRTEVEVFADDDIRRIHYGSAERMGIYLTKIKTVGSGIEFVKGENRARVDFISSS